MTLPPRGSEPIWVLALEETHRIGAILAEHGLILPFQPPAHPRFRNDIE